MRQIVKTEIIYYNTPKDFEFEFNLCGACQMRLLTETCEQKKDFLLSLSKAASRSKIILIITHIEKDFLNIITSAIGYPLDTIDREAFGIKTSPIEALPKSSVPLVDSAGELGGFVIERGPQSIIVLSYDNNVRNELMSMFVNQYIKDLSNYEPTFAEETSVSEAPSSSSEIKADAPASDTDTAENTDISEIPITKENQNIFDNSDYKDDEPTIASVQFPSELIEPVEETEETTAKIQLPVYYVDDSNEDMYATDISDYYDNTNKPTPIKPFNLVLLILLIAVCFLVIFLGYEFILSPILNGVSIADNFSNFWSSVF